MEILYHSLTVFDTKPIKYDGRLAKSGKVCKMKKTIDSCMIVGLKKSDFYHFAFSYFLECNLLCKLN